MSNIIFGSWWVLALRGVIAILFGVLALMVPGVTLLGLIALFAAYALLGGAVSVFAAIRNKTDDDYWWLLLLWGLVSIGAGVMAVVHPGLSALILVLVIGANALITGGILLGVAIRLRSQTKTRNDVEERRVRSDRRVSHAHS
jgi:uncharacterized membrane protein HdeD (DUF308 family)